MLDVGRIRAHFPILHQEVHGKPLAYLDNAATTQKPQQVLDAVAAYYAQDNANVHRGVHLLSERATRSYEGARAKVARFVGAARPEEVIFTRGTTEAVNLVAQAFVRPRVGPGDEIVITQMEHHSNIVPWQMVCQQTGATLKVVPITDAGELDMDAMARIIGPATRFVSVVHVSNALGTTNPVKEIVRMAHDAGAHILLDGAQALAHTRVDLATIGADFYALSGHKMYAPTGIGALVGRHELLETMAPWQGGGEMIRSVTFEKTEYNDVPYRFEAGTPDISGAIGLGAAIDYLEDIGIEAIAAHERTLLEAATKALSAIPGVRLIGMAADKAAVVSFTIDGVHPHDVGSLLDHEGIAVRTGHHCAQPVMDRFQVPATTRASFAMYNTVDEVDRLAYAVRSVVRLFAPEAA